MSLLAGLEYRYNSAEHKGKIVLAGENGKELSVIETTRRKLVAVQTTVYDSDIVVTGFTSHKEVTSHGQGRVPLSKADVVLFTAHEELSPGKMTEEIATIKSLVSRRSGSQVLLNVTPGPVSEQIVGAFTQALGVPPESSTPYHHGDRQGQIFRFSVVAQTRRSGKVSPHAAA